MSTPLNPFASQRQPGLREAMLLAVAAAFASLMMDFHEGAVICGYAAVAIWALAWFRGPRPSATVTLACGAGLFVTTMWWPREFWWQAAISLLWIGIALCVIGLVMLVMNRRTADLATDNSPQEASAKSH